MQRATRKGFVLGMMVAAASGALAQSPGRPGDAPRAAPDADIEVGVLTCNLQREPEPGPQSDQGVPSLEGQARVALCSFTPKVGSEELYVGTVRGVVLTAEIPPSVAWVVKTTAKTLPSGSLQQTFASDQARAADQPATLVGEVNTSVVLRPLADKPEGSASAKEKPRPTGFFVLSLELVLKGATA